MYKQRDDVVPVNPLNQFKEDKTPPNKFIIASNSYWNMIKNDITFCLFIIYMFVMPVITSSHKILSDSYYNDLGIFDVIFLADRIGDLFVSFINTNNVPEPKLHKVIFKNMGSPLYIELFITFSPWVIFKDKKGKINAMEYCLIKILRFIRISEMEYQINEILNYIGDSITVFELKEI